MTAVVIARNYAEAHSTAVALGLGTDWLYPHSAELLLGRKIHTVIYVEGWPASRDMTLEVMEELQARIDGDTYVREVVPPDVAARRLMAELAAPAPFVDPDALQPIPERRVRPRRSLRLSQYILLTIGFTAAVAIATSVLIWAVSLGG